VRLLLERTIPKMIKIELHLTGNLHQVNADASQGGDRESYREQSQSLHPEAIQYSTDTQGSSEGPRRMNRP
jgi:hypothetical protein